MVTKTLDMMHNLNIARLITLRKCQSARNSKDCGN